MKHFYLSEDGRTAMLRSDMTLISKQGLNLAVMNTKGIPFILKKFQSENELDSFFDGFCKELDEYIESMKGSIFNIDDKGVNVPIKITPKTYRPKEDDDEDYAKITKPVGNDKGE